VSPPVGTVVLVVAVLVGLTIPLVPAVVSWVDHSQDREVQG